MSLIKIIKISYKVDKLRLDPEKKRNFTVWLDNSNTFYKKSLCKSDIP